MSAKLGRPLKFDDSGNEIISLREKLDIPQQDLADALGISRSMLSLLEKDKQPPSKSVRIILELINRGSYEIPDEAMQNMLSKSLLVSVDFSPMDDEDAHRLSRDIKVTLLKSGLQELTELYVDTVWFERPSFNDCTIYGRRHFTFPVSTAQGNIETRERFNNGVWQGVLMPSGGGINPDLISDEEWESVQAKVEKELIDNIEKYFWSLRNPS